MHRPQLSLVEKMQQHNTIIFVLFIMLVLALGLAMSLGAVPIPLLDIINHTSLTTVQQTVLFDIRSPRVIFSAFVGAALALSGATLQGLFRNPLADPGLIGVASGGALGAVSIIVLGPLITVPDIIQSWLMPLAAFAGAATVTMFLYTFASRYGHLSIVSMLLVGIAINALATVGIGAFTYLSDDVQLRTLTYWMMGSFGRASWANTLPAILIIGIAMASLMRYKRQLDLLQLGESEARRLGVNPHRLKRSIVISVAAAIGASVALSGMIGFVGLVVPHLTRLIGGASNRYVLPASALLGATLMVLADLISRTIIIPAELPVGLVTSALGAPLFLWLIARVNPK